MSTTPTLETPPRQPQPQPPAAEEGNGPGEAEGSDSSARPGRIRTGRFGELDHHDLVHLLESLDTERERSRFRESIYISLFVWLAIAWFAIYGPKVLFHQGRIVTPAVEDRHKHELTYLELPPDLSRLPKPKSAPIVSDHSTRQQTAHPVPAQKPLEQMRPSGAPAAPAPKAPPVSKPAPQPRAQQPAPQPPQQQPAPAQPAPQRATPQPPQQQPAPAQPAPQRATPQPAPTQQARNLPSAPQPRTSIPDAPRPQTSTRAPLSGAAPSAGQLIAEATRDSGRGGSGGDFGANAPAAHAGANTGVEVLSDTMGVDFGPYLKRILAMIYRNWLPLIPEETRPPISKEGMTLIRFRIAKDGTLEQPHLDDSSHDEAINRAAWGSITSVGQFPPLPREFQGQNLDLRIQFNIVQRRGRVQ